MRRTACGRWPRPLRDVGEPVLVCTAARALARRGPTLAALLAGTGTAALAASGTLLVAARTCPPWPMRPEAWPRGRRRGRPAGSRPRHHLSLPPDQPQSMRVSGELNNAVRRSSRASPGTASEVTSLNVGGAGGLHPGRAPAARRPAPPAAVRRPRARTRGRAGGRVWPWPRWRAGSPGGPEAAGWRRTRSPSPRSPCRCAAAWFAAGSRILADRRRGAAVRSRCRCGRRAACGRGRAAAAAFGGWLSAMTGAAGGVRGVRVPGRRLVVGPAAPGLDVRDRCDDLAGGAADGRRLLRRPRPPGRRPPAPGYRLLRLAGQSIALPAGERTLLIAVAAPVWGPRMALIVLMGWGVVALGYGGRTGGDRPGARHGP